MNLFPDITPYQTHFLDVGDGHVLYIEECGNPDGTPITFLHGGPGSGCNAWQRRLFDPQKYRIILFDQRGSGRSIPHACLQANTTPHLVADMEVIRQHLNIAKWVITGGSWGSTLALAYADKHAEHITALVLYGMFLAREQELRALYCDGGIVSQIFPDIFEEFLSLLPAQDRETPLIGYDKLFRSDDEKIRHKAIEIWTRLEKRVSKVIVDEDSLNAETADPDFVIAHSLIENHYFLNNGFIDGDALLSRLSTRIKYIPFHIIQGRYDMVCPFKTAWEIHKAVPHSHLHIIEGAGHTAKETATTAVLLEVINTRL